MLEYDNKVSVVFIESQSGTSEKPALQIQVLGNSTLKNPKILNFPSQDIYDLLHSYQIVPYFDEDSNYWRRFVISYTVDSKIQSALVSTVRETTASMSYTDWIVHLEVMEINLGPKNGAGEENDQIFNLNVMVRMADTNNLENSSIL